MNSFVSEQACMGGDGDWRTEWGALESEDRSESESELDIYCVSQGTLTLTATIYSFDT